MGRSRTSRLVRVLNRETERAALCLWRGTPTAFRRHADLGARDDISRQVLAIMAYPDTFHLLHDVLLRRRQQRLPRHLSGNTPSELLQSNILPDLVFLGEHRQQRRCPEKSITPGNPVELFGIDQSPVHIADYCPTCCHPQISMRGKTR